MATGEARTPVAGPATPHVLLYGLIGLMVTLWSANYVIGKMVFREIPASLVFEMRTAVSAVLMVPIFWRNRAKWVRSETPMLLMLGLGGIIGNQLLWTLGAARTTVVHSSVIIGTGPIWVLLMATMMGMERLTWPKLGGMLVAISGIGLLQIFRSQQAKAQPTISGDLIMFASILLFAAMTAYGKRARPRSGPVCITAAAYLAGVFVCAPLYFIAGPTFDFGRVSWTAWAGVFYMGAMSSVTGYLIYYFALERISASRVAAFNYLQPVLASALALAVLGEPVTGWAVLAGIVIIGGVVVTERFG